MAIRQRVSLDDAAWLHMDGPNNHMVVNTLVVLGRRPDWDQVLAGFDERVIEVFPRFRQRVVQAAPTVGALGGPHWEDDPDFDLDHHVETVRLDGDSFEPALWRHLSHEAGRWLDRDRPRWKLQLIDGPDDRAAVLLRSHHSMADGVALVQVFLAMADPPGVESLHSGQLPVADIGSGALSAPLSPSVGEGLAAFANPARLRDAAEEARAEAKVYRKLMLLADQRNPLRARLTGDKHLGWTSAVPLDAVRLVAKATGTTVNDVALAVLAGALHRYLARSGGAIPYRIGVTVPFNLRDLDARLDPGLGNQIGLVFINLPVGISDARARLEHIGRRMAKIKASPEGEVVRGGMAMVGAIPTKGVAKAWMELFTGKCTAIVTNIVGPRSPISVGGAPVEDFLLWVPTSGSIGVGLSIVTYHDRLRLGIQVDHGVVSDPGPLLDAIDHELAQVDQLVAPRAS